MRATISQRTTQPMIVSDRPWETYSIGWSNILQIDGRWHMWYEGYDANYRDDSDGFLCYAVSDDGVKWTKPNLSRVSYHGDRNNNILHIKPDGIGGGIHGHWIFIDHDAPANERFKMVFVNMVDFHWLVYGATSPNGFDWTFIEKPILPFNSDTQSVCIKDGPIYRLYARMWDGEIYKGKRVVGLTESRDFRSFPEPTMILQPDDNDPPAMDFYNSAATKLRDDLYVMFPSAFHRDTDLVQPHLAISRDGRNFTRAQREPIIELNPNSQAFDCRGIYVSPGAHPGPTANSWWFYYLGVNVGHDAGPADKTAKIGGIGRFLLTIEGS